MSTAAEVRALINFHRDARKTQSTKRKPSIQDIWGMIALHGPISSEDLHEAMCTKFPSYDDIQMVFLILEALSEGRRAGLLAVRSNQPPALWEVISPCWQPFGNHLSLLRASVQIQPHGTFAYLRNEFGAEQVVLNQQEARQLLEWLQENINTLSPPRSRN